MILKRAADMIESFYTTSQQAMTYLPSPTPQSVTMRPMSLSSFNGIPPSPYYPYGGGSPIVNMGAMTNGGGGRVSDQTRPQIMVSEAIMEGNDEVFGDEIEVLIMLKIWGFGNDCIFTYLYSIQNNSR